MITDALLTLLFSPLGWLFDVLPDWTPPEWLSGTNPCPGPITMACYAHDAGQYLGRGSGWLPVSTAIDAASVVLGALAVVYGAKAILKVVSLFTGGGGAA